MSKAEPTLKEIKDLYKSVFYMQDDTIIDIILSITISAKLPGDPIWLLIIGGSSSGKSELINMLNKVPYVHAVSSMTENTFLSSMRTNNGEENSLLHKIGPSGMITMKDYTSILSMRSEKRELIVSQMREIFDGKLDKLSGNGNSQHWEGKINWIGAVTDSIYIKEGESAGMGRRTINYVMPQQDRKETTRRASANTGDIAEKRTMIQDAVARFVEYKIATLPRTLPVLTEETDSMLIDLADFVTQARTPVERDFKENIILVPDFEMPMRVYSMFQKMVQTMIHISDDQEFTQAHKDAIIGLAFDSIPKQIMLPLKLLAQHKAITTKGAAQELNYPSETVLKWLQNINVNKICDRRQVQVGKPDMWVMRDEFKVLLQEYLHITPNDDLLVDPDSEEEGTGNDINPNWMNQGNWGTDDKVEASERKELFEKQWDAL
jgi:hypothetical protein